MVHPRMFSFNGRSGVESLKFPRSVLFLSLHLPQSASEYTLEDWRLRRWFVYHESMPWPYGTCFARLSERSIIISRNDIQRDIPLPTCPKGIWAKLRSEPSKPSQFWSQGYRPKELAKGLRRDSVYCHHASCIYPLDRKGYTAHTKRSACLQENWRAVYIGRWEATKI